MQNDSSKHKSYRIKIVFVGTLFVFFFCAIVLRSYQLQILGNSKLNRLAESQYTRKLVVKPRRGTVYDRNGEPLAMDILVASIGLHPHQVQDQKKLRTALKKYTSLSDSQIRQKLKSSKKFLWVERRIDLEDGEALEDLRIKGVQVVREYRRYYPNEQMAGQLLGAVGYDAKALGGVELSFDEYLKADLQNQSVQKDARGRMFTPLDQVQSNHDLYLTIDKNIQSITEQSLEKYAKHHKVDKGFAVVMDVESGDLLAMANYPHFNPNLYWKYPLKDWKNQIVSDVFEPGSTFKTMLIASALQNEVAGPQSKFFCENGKYRIKNYTIGDTHSYGWLTTKDILKVSSNIGVTKIAEKLGREKFYDTITNLGFGQKIDVNLPGVLSGSLRHYKTWKDIELSNIAFGQGLSVNALQMVQAYSAFANKGTLVKPQIVKSVVSSTGKRIRLKGLRDEKKESVFSKKVSEDLKDMMFAVTQSKGTAPRAHIDGYLAAGKTGTAQKFDEKARAYTQDEYISSFIGFAPLKEPKLLIYVVFDHPKKNGHHGGVVAGPVFRNVAQQSLAYLGVVPEQQDQIKLAQGSFSEIPQVSKTGSSVPNLKGLSLRDVMQLASDYQVEIDVQGSGFVVDQFPQAGQTNSKQWKVILSSRS